MKNQEQTRADRILIAFFDPANPAPLWASAAIIAVISLGDWQIYSNLTLGFLYVLPVMILSTRLSVASILILSLLCAVVRETLAPFGWEPYAAVRVAVVSTVFASAGILVREVVRARSLAVERLNQLNESVRLRIQAEQQLRAVVETSPAAILTIGADGLVQLANQAAHDIFGFPAGGLIGQPADDLIPFLAGALHTQVAGQKYRTTVQTRCRRRGGETFLGYLWFATLDREAGGQIAAIVADTSADLREREEASLNQSLMTTRVLVGAVAHEIRNLCAAIAVVHANLGRQAGLSELDDYKALGTLAGGLSRLATQALAQKPDTEAALVDVVAVLDELRIILRSAAADGGIALEWDCPFDHLLVWADHQSLLQVFLNLGQNGIRALEDMAAPRLSVKVRRNGTKAMIAFDDTGPGVSDPEQLFRPFQPGSTATGLGLFVARAMVRLHSGDLRFVPNGEGCRFEVELAVAGPPSSQEQL